MLDLSIGTQKCQKILKNIRRDMKMDKKNTLLAELTVNTQIETLFNTMDVMIKFFDEEVEKSDSPVDFKAGYMLALNVIKTLTKTHMDNKDKRVKELVNLADAADSLVNMLNEKMKKKEKDEPDDWQKSFEEFLHGGDEE